MTFRTFAQTAIAASFAVLALPSAHSQGCVAVRQMTPGLGGDFGMVGEDTYLEPNQWQAGADYRYLHSFRHFVGTSEQYQRQAMGNQVINHVNSFDLNVTYEITTRLSTTLSVPFVEARRSQVLYTGGPRFETDASGLADMRLTLDGWIFDPKTHPDGNIAFGIGIKFPTGDDNVQGNFFRASGPGGPITMTTHAVDQSIQPGDGGWGAIAEVQGFLKIYKGLYGYLSAQYLSNPEGENGVLTGRSNPFEQVMSIPDQYQARAGFSYSILPKYGLSISCGGRIEGVPVHDLIGPSEGFRRPGLTISVEPGITWAYGKNLLAVQVPFAIYRERQTSVADMEQTAATGNPTHGDAAFADYLITASYARRF